MNSRAVRATLALLTLLLVSGCAATDRGYVQREWSKSLRELGIVPLFPPREDVFVGDVYAYPYDPESLRTEEVFLAAWSSLSDLQKQQRAIIGMSPRLARLDISAELDKEYKQTLSAPATTPDYNGILGNPALEAANQKVTEAERKLAGLKGIVAAASKAVSDANEKLLSAKRKHEDAQAGVVRAQAALTKAQAVPVDSSAEALAVEQAEKDVLANDDAVLTARRADEDAAPADKDSTARALVLAQRKQADATLALTRAKAALAAKRARSPNVEAEKAALAQANDALELAKTAELNATRERDDAVAAQNLITAAQTTPIAEATAALDNAKAIRTAIAQAGARMLYAQPRDATKSVYTGENLPEGSSPDDTMGSRTNRLRLVGFPEFATTSFSQGDLSALIPVEAMGLGINISSTNVERVSVKVPAAESYGLSFDTLLNQVANPVGDRWELSARFSTLVAAARVQTDNIGAKEGTIYLRVFSEVFYARALDVSIFAANSFGVRAQFSSPTTLIGAQTLAEEPSNLPAMSPATIDAPAAGSPASGDMLASIQARLGTTQTVPGGSVQLVSYSDKSIGLRRVFDRPIAIGVRALTVAIDLNGSGFRISVPGSIVPSTVQPDKK